MVPGLITPDLGYDLKAKSLEEKLEIIKTVPEGQVVIGSSLGGYLSCFVKNPKALVLIAPAFRLPERYPVGDYPNFPEVNCPVLIFHGDKDDSVPFSVSEEFVKLGKNRKLIRIMDGDHQLHAQLEFIWEEAERFLNGIETTVA